MTQWKSKIGVLSEIISSTESESGVSISTNYAYDSVAYDLVKIRLLESNAEAEEPANRKARNRTSVIGLFFRFCLRLQQCSFHLIVSDGVIRRISVLLLTPSVWFSVDRVVLPFWVRLWPWLRHKPASETEIQSSYSVLSSSVHYHFLWQSKHVQ